MPVAVGLSFILTSCESRRMNTRVSEAVVLLYQNLNASGNWDFRPVGDDALNDPVVHACR